MIPSECGIEVNKVFCRYLFININAKINDPMNCGKNNSIG